MATVFQGDEGKFAPSACEFWQANRIPRSPLYPHAQFLRWFGTDSQENYRSRGNKAFSVESVGYEFNSLGYRAPEFNRKPGEAVVIFLGDSHTFGMGMPVGNALDVAGDKTSRAMLRRAGAPVQSGMGRHWKRLCRYDGAPKRGRSET
jgi:hypothetical protein